MKNSLVWRLGRSLLAYLASCLAGLLLIGVHPQNAFAAPPFQLSVASTDQTLSYPNSLSIIPDEHTTVMTVQGPVPSPGARSSTNYRLFVAANNKGLGGTFVLD